jgi:hypothetical protein
MRAAKLDSAHRKNRSIVHPMKISINHDKFTDRPFDLPQLTGNNTSHHMVPTPKDSESVMEHRRRDLLSLSPSNPYSSSSISKETPTGAQATPSGAVRYA